MNLLRMGSMDARTVAEDGYRAMMAGKPVVISGFKNWLVAQSVRFSPRRLATAIARKYSGGTLAATWRRAGQSRTVAHSRVPASRTFRPDDYI